MEPTLIYSSFLQLRSTLSLQYAEDRQYNILAKVRIYRIWGFAANSNFFNLLYLQPDGLNLLYFKLRPFDLTELIVRNTKDLRHPVAKI